MFISNSFVGRNDLVIEPTVLEQQVMSSDTLIYYMVSDEI